MPTPTPEPFLARWTDVADILANVAQVFAFIVGGLWILGRYRKERQHLPRASMTHKIAHYRLPTKDVLLRLNILLKNPGSVVLEIESAIIRIQRVMPLPQGIRQAIEKGDSLPEQQGQIKWPSEKRLNLTWGRGEFEVEPGESDEVTREFILSGDLETVRVYSYFKNTRKKDREIGWGLSTLYDVGAKRGGAEKTVEDLSGKGDAVSHEVHVPTLEKPQQPPEPEREPGERQQRPEPDWDESEQQGPEPEEKQQRPEPDGDETAQQPPEEEA
ncbi:MAG: hypothetical protein ACRDIZ_05870 [Actinomycetota bacterium]